MTPVWALAVLGVATRMRPAGDWCRQGESNGVRNATPIRAEVRALWRTHGRAGTVVQRGLTEALRQSPHESPQVATSLERRHEQPRTSCHRQ
jgi:hypothetical protein